MFFVRSESYIYPQKINDQRIFLIADLGPTHFLNCFPKIMDLNSKHNYYLSASLQKKFRKCHAAIIAR